MEQQILDIFTNGINSNYIAFLLGIFAFGLLGSLNPCMLTMVPVILGGNRRNGFSRILMFSGGFILILILLGVASAALGGIVGIPGWLWTILLGLLYLIIGLSILNVKSPVKFFGFFISRYRFRLNSHIYGQGLHPFFLGAMFGFAPSPCTIPVLAAVTSFVLANGKTLLGALALGFFGLGHSVILALLYVPAVRNFLQKKVYLGRLRPVVGVALIILAIYFVLWQPSLFNQTSAAHGH